MSFDASAGFLFGFFVTVFIAAGLLVGRLVLGRGGSRRSRWFFALAVGLTTLGLVRVLLYHKGIIAAEPKWYFLPVWFSLAFGPAVFYATKFRLFPAYRLRMTDVKHGLFPLIQVLFFVWFLFVSDRAKADVFQTYVLGRYKFVEALLFLISWFTYLVLAYRYVAYRIAMARRFQKTAELAQYRRWSRMIKFLFAVGVINTTFIAADFTAYNFFNANLYDLVGFRFWSDLSYALLPMVLIYFGWRGAYPKHT